MEKIVEQAMLYDFYGELLTEHQKEVYEDAVFNDMSLGEISAERGISRQGVHDLIKRCNKILEDYESKLHLLERFLQLKEKVDEISRIADETSRELENQNKTAEALHNIKSLSGEILKEL